MSEVLRFPSTETPKRRFATRDPFDIGTEEEHHHIVEGVLPAFGVVPMVAAKESFKSFVAIDLGFHVATGKDWHGHAVKQGTVVYITAEDERGHRLRRYGWGLAHGYASDNSVPFRAIEASPYLGSVSGGDVNALTQDIEAEGLKRDLIIADTLNQGLGDADEDGSGMQAYMSNGNSLARHFGGVFMPIHHPGHSNRGRGRGGSQFEANSHNAILMKRWGRRKGDLTAFLALTKGRNESDSDSGLLITLRSIELPFKHRSGRQQTTLVVDSVVKAAKPKPKDRQEGQKAEAQAEAGPTMSPKHAALLEVMRTDPNGNMTAWGAALGGKSAGRISGLLDTMAKLGLAEKAATGKWSAR
jgi:AAA domain